ncbi:sodium/potassium-transporting ATPase subunit gamma isoform X1 [Osmerus eperlanus]|uniref:sodium/potassium-transporting ATPase subunit gamma isoform X1 n=1 Tax=Osmerus eperlanus TaxID=29151 RepID=UPI002E103D44
MGGDTPDPVDADFNYDYYLIRKGGLIFAGVLFLVGIAILFSKKLNCGANRKAKPASTEK